MLDIPSETLLVICAGQFPELGQLVVGLVASLQGVGVSAKPYR